MIDTERTEENKPVKSKIGRFDNEIIYLTPAEISKISKKYNIMQRNRQSFLAHVHKFTHTDNSIVKGTNAPKP